MRRKNGNKYLVLILLMKIRSIKKYADVLGENKYKIKVINASEESDYEKDYMNI